MANSLGPEPIVDIKRPHLRYDSSIIAIFLDETCLSTFVSGFSSFCHFLNLCGIGNF